MSHSNPIHLQAVQFAVGVIRRSTDWQEVQHEMFNHAVFGPWLTKRDSDGVDIIREAEEQLGDDLPAGYSD